MASKAVKFHISVHSNSARYKVFFWKCLVLNLEPCAWLLNSLPQIKYKPDFFKIWRKGSGSYYESKRLVDRLMDERVHRQWHSCSLWKEKAWQWILTNNEIKQTKYLDLRTCNKKDWWCLNPCKWRIRTKNLGDFCDGSK